MNAKESDLERNRGGSGARSVCINPNSDQTWTQQGTYVLYPELGHMASTLGKRDPIPNQDLEYDVECISI